MVHIYPQSVFTTSIEMTFAKDSEKAYEASDKKKQVITPIQSESSEN